MVISQSSAKKKSREEAQISLIKSIEFWEEYIKNELFNEVDSYLEDHGLTRKELAKKAGYSKGYISQILNGNSDHRISKLVKLALSIEKVPYIYFKNLSDVIDSIRLGDSPFINFKELEDKTLIYNLFRVEDFFADAFLDRKEMVHSTRNFNTDQAKLISFDEENIPLDASKKNAIR